MSDRDIYRTPHDETAEELFVGGILAGEGQALIDVPGITPNLCHGWTCRTILETCLTLHDEGAPVDQYSLVRVLKSSEPLFQTQDGGGWATEISRLTCAGLNSQVGYYLPILQDQLALRRMHAAFLNGAKEIAARGDSETIRADALARLAQCDPVADTGNHILPGVLDEILLELSEADAGRTVKSLQTAIAAWNRAFGGLPEGSYIALGGRPGTGKTAMLEQIVFQLICEDVPVCVFEKDMSPKKLMKRIACRGCGVPFWKLAKGFTSPEEREKIRLTVLGLKESRLRLYNPQGLTAVKLCSIVRREIQQHDIKAVFLDHIQVLDLAGEELRPGLTRASTILRANATETDVPHVVLCHLNRNAVGKGDSPKRPTPEDIKEFDQLYGDVDGMALLWSEQKMEDMEQGQSLPVNFYVAKNRDGAPTDDEMLFDGQHMTFREP